jgi:hypothetical protein
MSASWDPNKVVVAIAAVPIGAYQKDTFCEIAYDEDQVSVRHTIQGGAIYSVNRANGAVVTLTVEKTSNANALLSAAYVKQRTIGGGAFPFTIVDNNIPDGATFFNCASARLAKMPDQAFAAEAGPVQWKIICGECDHFIAALPADSALPLPTP